MPGEVEAPEDCPLGEQYAFVLMMPRVSEQALARGWSADLEYTLLINWGSFEFIGPSSSTLI